MHDYPAVQWLRKASLGLGILTLSSGALLLPACSNPVEEITEDNSNVVTEEGYEDYEATSPVSESIGEAATVRSPIQTTLDENGVLLESNGGEPILVLDVSPANLNFPGEGVPIQVTGQVVEFTIADVESEFGLNLDEDLYVDYEQQPAILASAWALAPTPEMLAENSDAFYNQTIALEGDARVLSEDALAVYEDGWIDDVGILVVGVQQGIQGTEDVIQDNESVAITGTAQPFDPNALDQYNLGLSESELSEFAERYTGRPIIIADDIYPSAVDD